MSKFDDVAARLAVEATEPIRALRLWSVRDCLDRLRLDVSEGRVTGMTRAEGETHEQPPEPARRGAHKPRDRFYRHPGGDQ